MEAGSKRLCKMLGATLGIPVALVLIAFPLGWRPAFDLCRFDWNTVSALIGVSALILAIYAVHFAAEQFDQHAKIQRTKAEALLPGLKGLFELIVSRYEHAYAQWDETNTIGVIRENRRRAGGARFSDIELMLVGISSCDAFTKYGPAISKAAVALIIADRDLFAFEHSEHLVGDPLGVVQARARKALADGPAAAKEGIEALEKFAALGKR